LDTNGKIGTTLGQQLQTETTAAAAGATAHSNELIKTLLEMRQALDALRNRPVPTPHPTPQPCLVENLQQGLKPRRMLKVATTAFHREMSKLGAFKKACFMYMQGCKDEFEDDQSKIIWILSYMYFQGGTALK